MSIHVEENGVVRCVVKDNTLLDLLKIGAEAALVVKEVPAKVASVVPISPCIKENLSTLKSKGN
jgi:hypothetical protein